MECEQRGAVTRQQDKVGKGGVAWGRGRGFRSGSHSGQSHAYPVDLSHGRPAWGPTLRALSCVVSQSSKDPRDSRPGELKCLQSKGAQPCCGDSGSWRACQAAWPNWPSSSWGSFPSPLPTPISPHRAGAETRVMSPEVPPVPTISSNELTGSRCRPQVKC